MSLPKYIPHYGITDKAKVITTDTTTSIWSATTGIGYLLKVVVITPSASGTFVIKNAAGTANPTGNSFVTDYAGTYFIDLQMHGGCSITTSGLAANSGVLLVTYDHFSPYD